VSTTFFKGFVKWLCLIVLIGFRCLIKKLSRKLSRK